tara:strand:- start:183 stop:344 length:162 start_codon:yes stop_codon:yes gene_type:complete
MDVNCFSKCQLCGKYEHERDIQDQAGYQLCLACDCAYTDEELKQLMKEKNNEI